MFLVDDIFTAINLQTNFIGLQKDFSQHGNTFKFEFSFLETKQIKDHFQTLNWSNPYIAIFSEIVEPYVWKGINKTVGVEIWFKMLCRIVWDGVGVLWIDEPLNVGCR